MAAVNVETRCISTISRKNRGLWTVYKVGEVICGGSPHLSCKRDQIKMRDYMDRWVTSPKRVTLPTWGLPPPCKQALTSGSLMMLQMDAITKWRNTKDWKITERYPDHKTIVSATLRNTLTSWLSFLRYFSCDCVLHVSKHCIVHHAMKI